MTCVKHLQVSDFYAGTCKEDVCKITVEGSCDVHNSCYVLATNTGFIYSTCQ